MHEIVNMLLIKKFNYGLGFDEGTMANKEFYKMVLSIEDNDD